MSSSIIPKNEISEKELIAKLQEHFKLNEEKDIIYHLLKLSGYSIDNGNLVKKDLLGQYERIIRIQFNKIIQLREQCEMLRDQQNRIINVLKTNHDIIGKCINEFTPRESDNLPLFGSTHSIPVNKASLNKNGNHANNNAHKTQNNNDVTNNIDKQGNNYSFEPNVARSAFVNSRTRSAPHIDNDNTAPNPIQLLSKNNYGLPFYSTSSLNIPKGQLKYPSLSPQFPDITRNLYSNLNGNNNNKNGFKINDILKIDTNSNNNNSNNNNNNNNNSNNNNIEKTKQKNKHGGVEENNEQQSKSKRRKFED